MSNPRLKYNMANINIPPEVHEILDSSTLYDFYKTLDNEFKNSISSDEKCSLCNSYVTMRTEESSKLNNLCKKVCYILLNFKDMENLIQTLTSVKCSAYMSTWLFNHITNIPNFNLKSDDFYSAINVFGQTDLSKIKNCTLKNYEINKSEFGNYQILYEFLEIYTIIEGKLKSQDDSKKNIYCKYIKEIFSLYHRIKEKCSSNNSCDKYNELQQFKEKFSISDNLTFIYDKCDYEKTSCKNSSNAEDDVPCLREKGNSFLYQIFGNDAENIINILLKVTTISAPILVLFVILFKFTPLGKNLNKIKQERKKSGHKKKEENIQDYMKNYAAHLDSEMKNRIHLGYHAT